jgi:TPR repeat protein
MKKGLSMGYKLANTLVLILALLATQAANAGLDEGVAAYNAKDYATALKELRPFAEQGNAVAQYNLGAMYDTGKGIVRDNQQAEEWYRKAAEQGNADAQYNLGKRRFNRLQIIPCA